MNCRGERQENPFTLQFEGGRPTHVKRGKSEWMPVPNGTRPTGAYPLVLRSGMHTYSAFIEGTGDMEIRELRREGALWVEYSKAKAVRKFHMQGDQIISICWGETMESHLVGSRSKAVKGTVFE